MGVDYTLSLDVYHGGTRVGHDGGVRQPMPPLRRKEMRAERAGMVKTTGRVYVRGERGRE
jgi:hypothetical protein